jgi:hypothetical protein
MQQVPHANGYRRCFRAPEGRKFCIVDYSQIELRILAEFSQDPAFPGRVPIRCRPSQNNRLSSLQHKHRSGKGQSSETLPSA